MLFFTKEPAPSRAKTERDFRANFHKLTRDKIRTRKFWWNETRSAESLKNIRRQTDGLNCWLTDRTDGLTDWLSDCLKIPRRSLENSASPEPPEPPKVTVKLCSVNNNTNNVSIPTPAYPQTLNAGTKNWPLFPPFKYHKINNRHTHTPLKNWWFVTLNCAKSWIGYP